MVLGPLVIIASFVGGRLAYGTDAGRIGGRRPKLLPQQQTEVLKMVTQGKKSAADAARLFNVHPATISRLLAAIRRQSCCRQKVGRRMALRELLSSVQREALEAIPVDRARLIEHYVLSDQDLSLVRRRRGAQNRFGLAVRLSIRERPINCICRSG
jgi:DNA-binding CsgD family transcriptional regulator